VAEFAVFLGGVADPVVLFCGAPHPATRVSRRVAAPTPMIDFRMSDFCKANITLLLSILENKVDTLVYAIRDVLIEWIFTVLLVRDASRMTVYTCTQTRYCTACPS
jgi:hypothetical protein